LLWLDDLFVAHSYKSVFTETRALSLEEIDGLFSNPGFAGSNEDLNPVPIPDLVESSARTSGEEKGEPKV
jgi:hypothetical protein